MQHLSQHAWLTWHSLSSTSNGEHRHLDGSTLVVTDLKWARLKLSSLTRTESPPSCLYRWCNSRGKSCGQISGCDDCHNEEFLQADMAVWVQDCKGFMALSRLMSSVGGFISIKCHLLMSGLQSVLLYVAEVWVDILRRKIYGKHLSHVHRHMHWG